MVLSLDDQGELSRCLRCGANFRYEVLADYLRGSVPNITQLNVVEMDPNSPLSPILSRGKTYTRTYYSPSDQRGSTRTDGARCEDVTSLTLPDNSVDLLVSSEVLEHVPDLKAAAREITRVLSPGGRHVFTVPTVDKEPTLKRAEIEGGSIKHLAEPEYHGDPLGNGQGILAFWTFGRDAAPWFSTPMLETRIAMERWFGPKRGLRVVWESVKRS
jgi:SAM-dependent methyltransferase